ncbi:MAG: nuclear transport factor 2 family protein [Actinomycetota bacterium]
MGSEQVLDRYYAAMRRGAAAEDEMIGLFADDAVYDEPFSGEPPAEGLAAIRARLRKGWEFPLPDLELDVLEVEVSGPQARTVWECRSSALPGPMRGEDRYEIEDGRITRLQVRFLDR